MSIYTINVFLLIIGYVVWYSLKDSLNYRKLFCIQATIQWILISGLRSLRVGADTYRYSILFEEVSYTPWPRVLENFKLFLMGNLKSKDYGYVFFQKIIQTVVDDYQFFLFVVAILIFIPMGIWIYKHSANVLMSYILFSTLFYSFFAITGTRQSIVTAIGIFMGEKLLKNKKHFAYIILVLILSLVHKSALILLLYLLVYQNKKISTLYLLVSTLIIGVCWVFKGQLMTLATSVIGYEQYAEQQEGTGAYVFTFLYMAIFFISVLFWNKIITFNKGANIYFVCLIFGACLLPLVSINQSAMRSVQYFSIYLMLLVPQMIEAIVTKRQRVIVYICCEAILIFLLIQNNPSYTFFWQI